jgi:hypothetical protein
MMNCRLLWVEYVAIAAIKADEYIAADSITTIMTGKRAEWWPKVFFSSRWLCHILNTRSTSRYSIDGRTMTNNDASHTSADNVSGQSHWQRQLGPWVELWCNHYISSQKFPAFTGSCNWNRHEYHSSKERFRVAHPLSQRAWWRAGRL